MLLRRIPGKAKRAILISLSICVVMVLGISAKMRADGGRPIMARNSVTIGQMMNFFQANASYPSYYAGSDAPLLYDFCAMYYQECEAEGVDVNVAFSQAMIETGFLRFGGNVSISQYNFGGIDARAGIAGRSYSSVRQGIRAQVQRLKIYASSTPINRFNNPLAEGVEEAYYNKLSGIHGTKKYVEDLNTWGGSSTYYQSVLNMMGRLSSASTYTTWYNGVDYSPVYDPYYYANHSPDVKKAYSNSGDGMIWHFIQYGIHEGRRGNNSFDVYSYRRQYPDLRRAFGNDLAAYYKHYTSYGYKEGRAGTGCTTLRGATTVYNGVDYSSVYDYSYYSSYGDLWRIFGEDENAMISHFVNYGMHEGRQGNSAFSVRSYKLQYADLRAVFGNDLAAYYRHFMNYGKREGRAGTGCTTLRGGVTRYNGIDYSAVYDYSYYSSYGDLKRAFGEDDVAMLSHFVNYGMSEGRKGSDKFDVKSYRLQYADLRGVFGNDLRSYYMHFVNYGKREGRAGTGCTSLRGATTTYNGVNYSAVYDYSYYSSYGDLKRAFGEDDVALLSHFVNYGMSEGRKGNTLFNLSVYKNRYPDLRAAFGDNNAAYYYHYMSYGRTEGRKAS